MTNPPGGQHASDKYSKPAYQDDLGTGVHRHGIRSYARLPRRPGLARARDARQFAGRLHRGRPGFAARVSSASLRPLVVPLDCAPDVGIILGAHCDADRNRSSAKAAHRRGRASQPCCLRPAERRPVMDAPDYRQEFKEQLKREIQDHAREAVKRPKVMILGDSRWGLLWGAIIVLVGAAVLLDNMGISGFDRIYRFWPMILIVFGIMNILLESNRGLGALLI